ncbi:hypothetical protein A9264_03390 [Vibrio sp. UCD-FRSSP16_10]|nr:hypothetical protein A9260_04840 [Vibrio sp. UCD-FRSSP16_30]OBT20523.1 hypothetical protein A9264_03390 [Vibrio sp. UCD-FRSSP16_10]
MDVTGQLHRCTRLKKQTKGLEHRVRSRMLFEQNQVHYRNTFLWHGYHNEAIKDDFTASCGDDEHDWSISV